MVLWVVERWYSDTQERSLVSVVHYESRLPLIDTNSSRVLQRKQANHSGSSHHLFKWLGFQVEWPSKQGCVNHAIDPATFHQPKARVMLGRIFPTPTKMFLCHPHHSISTSFAPCVEVAGSPAKTNTEQKGSDLKWNTFAGLSWCILELYNNMITCIDNTYISCLYV